MEVQQRRKKRKMKMLQEQAAAAAAAVAARPVDARVKRLIPESRVFGELVEAEKIIDQALFDSRWGHSATKFRARIPKTLRLHVYTVMKQASESSHTPTWTLRIQGRLLDRTVAGVHQSSARRDREAREHVSALMLSNVIKRVCVHLKSDLYEGEDFVEWCSDVRDMHANTTDSSAGRDTPPASRQRRGYDCLEVTREMHQHDTSTIDVDIALEQYHRPRRFAVSRPLARMLGLVGVREREETRQGVVKALHAYCQTNLLLDSVKLDTVKMNDELRSVFGGEETEVPLSSLLSRLSMHLSPPDPIIITHTISVLDPRHQTCYDVELDMDEVDLHPETASIANPAYAQNVKTLEDRIQTRIDQIALLKKSKTFFEEFAAADKNCIEWMMSKVKEQEMKEFDYNPDLQNALTDEEKQNRLFRSMNFTQCWVHEVMPEVLHQSQATRRRRSRWTETSIFVANELEEEKKREKSQTAMNGGGEMEQQTTGRRGSRTRRG